MKVVLILILLSAAGLAGGGEGVTARFVPDQVRPGEVFELRVEMERAEYGRFELQVPPHGSLHLVAVEPEPVRLEDGLCRQRERWMLQADRSGEIVVEGMVVLVKTGSGESPVALSPLRVEVLPWGSVDESTEPAAFPPRRDAEPVDRPVPWLLLAAVALVLAGWWWRFFRKTAGAPGPGDAPCVADALAALEAGHLRSPALERLMAERGGDWPEDLRKVVEQAVYAGRGEAAEVALLLRKEVDA